MIFMPQTVVSEIPTINAMSLKLIDAAVDAAIEASKHKVTTSGPGNVIFESNDGFTWVPSPSDHSEELMSMMFIGAKPFARDVWQIPVRSCYDMRQYDVAEQDKLQIDLITLERWVDEMRSGKHNIVRKMLYTNDIDEVRRDYQVFHGSDYEHGNKVAMCADGVLFVMMNGWRPYSFSMQNNGQMIFKSKYMKDISTDLLSEVARMNDKVPGGMSVGKFHNPWIDICYSIDSIISKIKEFINDHEPIDANSFTGDDHFMASYPGRSYGSRDRVMAMRRHIYSRYVMNDLCIKPMAMDTFCVGTC